jgi:hypothetical protein
VFAEHLEIAERILGATESADAMVNDIQPTRRLFLAGLDDGGDWPV